MASSLESVKNCDKKQSRPDIGSHARQLFSKFRQADRSPSNLAEEQNEQIAMSVAYDDISHAYSNSFSDEEAQSDPRSRATECTREHDDQRETCMNNDVWKDRDAETAERLAKWSDRDVDASSPLVPNGKTTVITYGTSDSEPRQRKSNDDSRKKDKWSSAIKQIQKHKKPRRSSSVTGKIAGRNRAKKIDQRSRWIFPATFIVFNVIYWYYYLYWKE